VSAQWEGASVDAGAGGHDSRLTVFISSTLGELKSERDAAQSAVKSLRLRPAGVDFGARGSVGSTASEDADVFVGIYWQSLGWRSEDGHGSELERDYDRSAGLPGLVYVKEPAMGREEGLTRLLERMRSEGRVSIRSFESPGELAEMLVEDLPGVMADRFSAAGPEPGSLPLGTLTFMFGDLAGSTSLVVELGPEYADILLGYHRVVAEATARHGGTVVDLEGERLFTVFTDPFQAVGATVEIQEELGRREWPGSHPVWARLGLHTGTARIGSGGYVGLDVHRASRVSSSAHGGQIIVSAPVRELVEPQIAEAGWELRELGSFALKGLSRAEKLFQVVAPGIRAEFPPPRARSTSRVRLPTPQSSLVGRDTELFDLLAMLGRPEVRLATIVGAAGVGKTRLALSVAEEASASFPDGVYFVNLAPITDPGQVLPTIGNAAGIPIEGEALDALSSEFGDQQVLLVIDTFEQVAEAGSEVADLLARCPGLKVLATSRVPLRIMSEYEYTLEPLGLPAGGAEQVESISASAAVRLFLDRALSVLPGFSINEENASPVASIVSKVDGLPLAIELAAARLRMLSPKALSERLTRSLDALGTGAADVPSRQKTLDAAIDWSYQLLTREEQDLFCRLCVFQGGFTVESAQEVAVEEGDVVDQLMVLVENSLVLPAQGGEGRLRMLAPIREFGLRRLVESGDHDRVKDRHANYYVRMAEASLADLRGVKQKATVDHLAADWNNLEVAADWLVKRGDDASLVRMAHGMWVFLWIGNHLRDGDRYLSMVSSPEDLDALLAGRYWFLRGGISYEMGDYGSSKESIDRAVKIVEDNGDIDTHNWSDFLSALLLPVAGEDPTEIEKRLEVSLNRFRGFGDRWGEGYALIALGILAGSRGDAEAAEGYQVATREIGADLGNGAMIGLAEAQLGFTHISTGQMTAAREALRRSFDLFREMNYREGLCYALEAAASLSFTEGQAELGMIALGAAEDVRERIGLHPWPLIMWLFDALSSMADFLEDPALQAARHNGRQMNPFDAAEVVLAASPVSA
jgi:predicted ATPase/class 3 adenylate cyclase